MESPTYRAPRREFLGYAHIDIKGVGRRLSAETAISVAPLQTWNNVCLLPVVLDGATSIGLKMEERFIFLYGGRESMLNGNSLVQ